MVLGHEAAGVVAKLGSSVSNLKVGSKLIHYIFTIWVVLPRTGKMSNICPNFFFWSFTVAKRFDVLNFRQLF